MTDPKFSIVIPYRDRIDNLRIALEALSRQTLDTSEFEVIVGVMEYSDRYLEVCRDYRDRLTLVSVLSERPWQIALARNLALRQARGEVAVLMDVDMALPPRCLENLYDLYFAYRQNVCVVGQMLDYDNNTGNVTSVEVKPYAHYRKLLDDLEAEGTRDRDPRLHSRYVVPWSFAWTALIALPVALIRTHDLESDTGFHGYGVEDLEWAYRVCRTATPVVMGRDFFGVHLPHLRDVAANARTEAPNYRYFLRTWPGAGVELACAFGDFTASEAYLDFRHEIAWAAGSPGACLAVVHVTVNGETELVIGVAVAEPSRMDDAAAGVVPAGGSAIEVLPIVGLALPYDDDSVRRCRVLPPVMRLAPRYREQVVAEARRGR